MNERYKTFQEIALLGPATFFTSAFRPEELAERFDGYSAATARDFVLLRTLGEVQKYGATSRRWDAERERHSTGERFDELVLASMNVERAAWQRRLLEGLVALINFTTTNSVEYYAHYLAVQEYDRECYAEADEKDFFGEASELTARRLYTLRAAVDSARAQLPASPKVWYLKSGKPYTPATLRTQYLRALGLARPSERTALGYTYRLSFGGASSRLHFAVLDASNDPKEGTTEAICGLLAIALICRAHDLQGLAPGGINRSLMQPQDRDRPVSDLLAGRAELGDFVLIAGPHLAEVKEIRKGNFDYESYRLEFLDTKQGPGLSEAWLPAPAVALFMKRAQLIDDVRDQMKAHTVGDGLSLNELREATRAAVIDIWNLGVRSYVERLTQPTKGEERTSDA